MSWKFLERLSTVLVVLLSGVLLVYLYRSGSITSSKANSRQALETGLKGKRLAIPNIDFRAADSTIVLALSTNCKFCDQSMAFYKELLSNRDRARARVQIVGVYKESMETAKAYLTAHQVVPDRVLSLPSGLEDVKATPTALLVDPDGVVRDVWVGMLNKQRQVEFINTLKDSCQTCQALESGKLD